MQFLSLFFSFAALGFVSAHDFNNSSYEERATLPNVITSCTAPNTAALTFDDGPYKYTRTVSKTLLDAGAKGTFFLNGNNYQCIYTDANVKRVKYLLSKGHQIASHTWRHEDLATLNWDQLHDEMWRVELALKRIAGVVPAYMRPPFGSYNDMVREVAQIRGQKVAIWDFDSGDSVGATVAQSKKDYNAAIKKHPSSILTLNHETIETTALEVLPYAIKKLQAAGYNLVTLAECLGDSSPYQSQGEPEERTDEWNCN